MTVRDRMKPMWVAPEFHRQIKAEAARKGLTIKKLTSQLAEEAARCDDDLKKRGGFRFKL